MTSAKKLYLEYVGAIYAPSNKMNGQEGYIIPQSKPSNLHLDNKLRLTTVFEWPLANVAQ